MPESLLAFNGIDGSTGSYLLPSMPVESLSLLARGQALDPNHLNDLKRRRRLDDSQHYGVKEGVDPKDLSQTGWGVIFAAGADPALREALAPLLNLRRAQASSKRETRYREYTGVNAYRPHESKNDFLSRHGAGPGAVDPDKVPYYLLIIGDPETIPFRFQYQLDVQYGVGRIHFETLDEYARYAHNVVEAESGKLALPRRAAFFGVANPGDRATHISSADLVQPLSESTAADKPDWTVTTTLGANATKSALRTLLADSSAPSLLFTASHGMGYPNGHPYQFEYQGALLCQDWPGPSWQQAIPRDFFFAGEDLPPEANLLGTITMHFACYGGGTPNLEDFVDVGATQRAEIAPRAFMSRLPQSLLAHPRGGALATIAHVERSWGYSFKWDRAGRQLQVFQSTLKRLMEGHPAGSAMEYFNGRYAELSSDLSSELEEIRYGKQVDDYALSGMWTANNDARSYSIIGDPAVRLMLADAGQQEKRPVMEQIVITTDKTKPTEEPVGVESYGMFDSLKENQAKLSASLQHVVERIGASLATAFESLTTVEVATYVSSSLSDVKYEDGKFAGASLRALTRASLDGNTLVCVPEQDGKVDDTLWKIHSEIVEKALANRTEMLKLSASALSSLASGLKLT